MRSLRIILELDHKLTPKGHDTVLVILSTARDIFVNEGYGSFSLQKVADACGIARGNVTYYFANREELLRKLLGSIIRGYMDDFDNIIKDDRPAEEKLEQIISLIINDLGTRETSVFFPDLWALAGHNEVAAKAMKELYVHARKYLVTVIKKINPRLNNSEYETLALFISAAMEGQTPFVGYNRSHANKRKVIERISIYTFLKIVKEMDSDDLNPRKSRKP